MKSIIEKNREDWKWIDKTEMLKQFPTKGVYRVMTNAIYSVQFLHHMTKVGMVDILFINRHDKGQTRVLDRFRIKQEFFGPARAAVEFIYPGLQFPLLSACHLTILPEGHIPEFMVVSNEPLKKSEIELINIGPEKTITGIGYGTLPKVDEDINP